MVRWATPSVVPRRKNRLKVCWGKVVVVVSALVGRVVVEGDVVVVDVKAVRFPPHAARPIASITVDRTAANVVRERSEAHGSLIAPPLDWWTHAAVGNR
jgi:hypothetical protein